MSKQFQVRLYARPEPQNYAEGGLTALAEKTREAGRKDDDILLHLSKEEFDWLKSQWGEPEINPHTGLPEYSWLSKGFKKVSKAVKSVVKNPLFQALAPQLLNFIVPGLGVAIGSTLGASGATAAMLGKAVVGAGLGAAGGGSKGALTGAISGGLAGGAGKALGNAAGMTGKLGTTLGNSVLSGLQSEVGGGKFGQGAVMGGLQSLAGLGGSQEKPAIPGTPGFNPTPDFNSPEISIQHAGVPGPTTGILDKLKQIPGQVVGYAKEHPWQTAGLTALALSQMNGSGGEDSGPPASQAPPGYNEHLPQLNFQRKRRDPTNYYTYGFNPEQAFYEDNALPEYTPKYAEGGPLSSQYIRSGTGASGRADNIDARLSENEYVIDAETVSLLGDGNPDAGAAALDEMRAAIRKQKGQSLAKGKFTEPAKSPLAYLGGH